MEIDEDDDFYADDNSANTSIIPKTNDSALARPNAVAKHEEEDDRGEDEEDEEESDSVRLEFQISYRL